MVLDGSPHVLSLGQRCLPEGYSFRWDAGVHPVLPDPEGVEQTLELDWPRPVLTAAAPSSSAVSAEVEESTSAGFCGHQQTL